MDTSQHSKTQSMGPSVTGTTATTSSAAATAGSHPSTFDPSIFRGDGIDPDLAVRQYITRSSSHGSQMNQPFTLEFDLAEGRTVGRWRNDAFSGAGKDEYLPEKVMDQSTGTVDFRTSGFRPDNSGPMDSRTGQNGEKVGVGAVVEEEEVFDEKDPRGTTGPSSTSSSPESQFGLMCREGIKYPYPKSSSTNSSNSSSEKSQQPPELKTSPQLRMVYRSLPTFFQTLGPRRGGGKRIVETLTDINAFLTQDLDVSRLNDIHSWLWMAGRPLVARPLHRHRMLGREFLLTEQADLHMLVDGNRFFLKPLPLYLVSGRFWRAYLCSHPALHGQACGLLLSYVSLIRSEHDFAIALEAELLPRTNPPISWDDWKKFVSSFHRHVNPNDLAAAGVINKRYLFGELRLGRINTIYRLAPQFVFRFFIRGYLYGYNRYSVFFKRRMAWLLVFFVFLDIILSAMQVGQGTAELGGDRAFMRACYGFVVFSMTLVLAVLTFVAAMFGTMYFVNMILAIRHSLRAENRRHRVVDRRVAPVGPDRV